MTLGDWHQAQDADPVLSLVIARLRDGMLGKGQSKTTDSPEISQYRWDHNHLVLKKGVLYRWARPRESRGDPPLVGLASCTEGGRSQRMS